MWKTYFELILYETVSDKLDNYFHFHYQLLAKSKETATHVLNTRKDMGRP